MKKYIFLSVFLFAVNFVNAQNYANQPDFFKQDFSFFPKDELRVQDSIYFYLWNGSEWQLNSREKTLDFDANGNILNAIRHFYDQNSGTWGNKKDIVAKQYYNDNKLKETLTKPWNSSLSQWGDTSYCLKYTDSGEILLLLYRNWMYSHNYFSYGFKDVYSHKENGKIDFFKEYYWNGIWNLDFKVTYYYNGAEMLTKMINQKYENGSFTNDQQILLTYDSENRKTSKTRQVWNSGLNDWVNDEYTLYTYNENDNLKEELVKYWNPNSNDWVSFQRTLYSYNNDNSLTEKLTLLFGSDWVNYDVYTYLYDDDNNMEEMTYKEWDTSNNVWLNQKKSEYFTSDHSGIDFLSKNIFSIYPNPTEGIFTIDIQNSEIPCRILINDISGKTIQDKMLANKKTQVDLSKQANGIYFIRIMQNDKVFTDKIIKN